MEKKLFEAAEEVLDALDSDNVRVQARTLPADLRVSEALHGLQETVEEVKDGR